MLEAGRCPLGEVPAVQKGEARRPAHYVGATDFRSCPLGNRIIAVWK